ncbi:MAG: hypothetical protein ACREAC_03180, partial [Blastocatellia bacterium]
MAQRHSIEIVIKQVEATVKPADRTQVLVIIDAGKKCAVRSAGLLRFVKDLKYFLVSNSLNARNVARAHTTVTFREGVGYEHTISVNIDYLASCAPGNEEKVAEALFDGRT